MADRITITLDREDASWLRRHLSNFSSKFAVRVYDAVRDAERQEAKRAERRTWPTYEGPTDPPTREDLFTNG